MKIRLLNTQDIYFWKQLRLEALQGHPELFGGTYEEEVNCTDDDWKAGLKKRDIFGAFIDDILVGSAGFYSLATPKTRHRGVLFAMYITPKHRGKGIANLLVEAIISHAKLHVMQLHLTCLTSNFGAIKLYQKYGFNIYGTEPRTRRIGDVFFDEHLMVLDLNSSSSPL